MDLPITEISTLLGGSATAGTVTFFVAKSWASRVEKKIDKLCGDMQNQTLEMAKLKGQIEKDSALIWREINTDKQKITHMKARTDKAWEAITNMGPHVKRISDLFREGKK